jgi:hypothetical protein
VNPSPPILYNFRHAQLTERFDEKKNVFFSCVRVCIQFHIRPHIECVCVVVFISFAAV